MIPQEIAEKLAEDMGWGEPWAYSYIRGNTILMSERGKGVYGLSPAGAFDVLVKMGWCADPCFADDPGYWQVETSFDLVLATDDSLDRAIEKAVIAYYSATN